MSEYWDHKTKAEKCRVIQFRERVFDTLWKLYSTFQYKTRHNCWLLTDYSAVKCAFGLWSYLSGTLSLSKLALDALFSSSTSTEQFIKTKNLKNALTLNSLKKVVHAWKQWHSVVFLFDKSQSPKAASAFPLAVMWSCFEVKILAVI